MPSMVYLFLGFDFSMLVDEISNLIRALVQCHLSVHLSVLEFSGAREPASTEFLRADNRLIIEEKACVFLAAEAGTFHCCDSVSICFVIIDLSFVVISAIVDFH